MPSAEVDENDKALSWYRRAYDFEPESTDLFAAGACLWEGLTGKRLFDGKTAVATFQMIISGAAPPLTEERDDLPAGLPELVASALDPDPSKRPGSALDFAEGLTRALKKSRVRYWRDRLGEAVRQAKKRT